MPELPDFRKPEDQTPSDPSPKENKEKAKSLSKEEVVEFAKKFDGEIIEDSSKFVSIRFPSIEECRDFYDEIEDQKQKIQVGIAYGFGEEYPSSINEILESQVTPFRRSLSNFKTWRKEVTEPSFHYVDGYFKYKVEGDYNLENGGYNGDHAYISPRFISPRGWSGEINNGFQICGWADTFNLNGNRNVILSREDFEEMMKNTLEWLRIGITIQASFRDVKDGTYEMDREALIKRANEAILERVGDNESLKLELGFEGSAEDFKAKIMGDTQNYLAFLDRSYEALERFIAKIESYKKQEEDEPSGV